MKYLFKVLLVLLTIPCQLLRKPPKRRKLPKPRKPQLLLLMLLPVESVVEVSAHAEPSAPVVEAPSSETQITLETLFSNYNKKLSELRALEASLISDFKKLQKATMKHLKEMSKKNKKRKLTDEEKKKRAPSGFAKPTKISEELCKFLGMKKGTEIARTEVTKHLTTYIKTNKLQDESNKRKILP